MLKRLLVLLGLSTLALSSSAGPAQSAAEDVASAASVLVLGRTPLPAELDAGSSGSLGDQIGRWQQRVQREPALKRAMLVQSYRDAFGRGATEAELADSGAPNSYIQAMNRHLQVLAGNTDLYEQVIRKAYQVVICREAYAEEVAYWRKRGPLTFVLLVGGLDGWARRNQPGLMVTGGEPTISINCVYLTTVRLSAADAAQALSACGLPAGDRPAASVQHVIAAGGERVATSGGMSFVVAGRPRLLD